MVEDKVYVGKKLIGKVAGFDDTHMPNHQIEERARWAIRAMVKLIEITCKYAGII